MTVILLLMGSRQGFTLIEILVAIAIFALTIGILVVRFSEVNKKAKIAKAQKDLEEFKIAIEILYQDTGQHPAHIDLSPCVQNPEVDLDSCSAGLLCTDGGFPNWYGPYITNVQLDPWDQKYQFDPDYTCNGQVGCEGIGGGTTVRAVRSLGEDGNQYTSDDVAAVLCR